MKLLENVARALLLVITAVLPFEFWQSNQELSVLQLLFIAITVVSVPILLRDWRRLAADRFVIAAGAVALAFWLTALLSESFRSNAVEAAIRVTCGFVLMCIVMCVVVGKSLERVLCWTAVAAAGYGLLDFFGLGMPSLFRSAEFYLEDVQRLSGSFEYPNTAAAFYAMCLPFVWAYAPALSGIVWLALVLTFTRGAFAGLIAVLIAASLLKRYRGQATGEESGSYLRSPLVLAGVGIAVFALAAFVQPILAARFQPFRAERASTNARYDLHFNLLTAGVGIVGHMPVVVHNTGSSQWSNVALSAHWYDTKRRRLVGVSEIVNWIPDVVGPNQTVSLDAAFRTPDAAGSYLLDWDLKFGNRWLSIVGGVPPGIVEAKIESGASESLALGDTSRWYGTEGPSLDATVTRSELWWSGFQLFKGHPLIGIGPDNFRLRYGQMLGYPRWDTKVRANSLYVELLVGCGILGLIAFGTMILSVRWSIQPATIAVAVFLVHGLVDAFLMTTPIYFAFWLLLGRIHERRV